MNLGDKRDIPAGCYPIRYVSNESRLLALRTKAPFGHDSTSDFFGLTNQIDSRTIEGHIGRTDTNWLWINDVRERLEYLIKYSQHEKVFFTFDRVSLYELTGWFPSYPQPTKFILRRVDENRFSKPNTAFMIMPFHQTGVEEFYSNKLKPFLENDVGISIYRADDFNNNDIIIDTIYSSIEESEIIIADTTIANKNAFYELGYAAAKGKEIITVQNSSIEQQLFFDRSHIRTLFYNLEDLDKFFFELKATINSIRQRQ